jgi:hypothetical protein
MRGRITRLVVTLVLATAVVAAATRRTTPFPVERDLTDSLHRAQIEQELILAEGTAAMYGDLERALADMATEDLAAKDLAAKPKEDE